MEPNKNVRTDLVEIVVNNTGVTEFILGQLPNLRSAKCIMQVEAYSVAQVPVAPSTKAVINATVFLKSFLRLIDTLSTELRTIPLVSLSKATGADLPVLNLPPIDTEKSKIVVGSAAGLVANEVFLLAITYEK